MTRLTRAQVREIDRLSIERYGIPGIVLMENAARAAAEIAHAMIGPGASNVAIFCGGGNNGGDGLAIARHLHNRGHAITVHLIVRPDSFRGDALVNWRIARAMNIPVTAADPAAPPTGFDLIVDAMFGTGLDTPPRPDAAAVINAVNQSKSPVLAVDVPSGLDCDAGLPLGPCVGATRTVTFVAEKTGFAHPNAARYLGRIQVADIGCPRELIEEVSRETK